MRRLCIILGDRHCILYLWKMFKIFAKNWGVVQEQLQRLINSRLRYQKEHHSRCQTWTFLNGNECTSRIRKCCKKLVNSSMKDINPYLRDSTKTTHKEVLCHSRVDRGADYWTWQDCLGGPFFRRNKTWKDFKIQNIGYSRWIKTLLNNHKINDLILLKQNENAKECTTNMWKRLNKNIDKFLVNNNHDDDEDTHSKESTSTTIESILEPAGGSTRKPVAFVLVNKLGPWQLDDEKLKFLAFFAVWQFVIFLWVQDQFRLPANKLPDNRRGCEQNTHSYSMYRCAQCVSTSHCTVWSLFITRTHVAQF